MALIPRVTENSVTAAPEPRQRLQAQDFGGDIVSRSVERAAGQVMDAALRWEQSNVEYDTAAVKKADAAFEEELRPLRNSVLAAQGLDAVAARTKAQAQITELRKRFESGLANDRQRRMFSETFGARIGSDLDAMERHEIGQVRVANVAAANARGETYLNRAIDLRLAGDEEAAAEALATAKLERRAALPGAGEDTIVAETNKLVSSYHSSIAETLRGKDALEAAEYLDKHAGEILPDDETKMRRAIQPELDEAQVEAAFAEVLGGTEAADPKATRAEVAEGFSFPIRGAFSVSNTAAQHRARGSGNAIDIPAPEGTPIYAPMTGKVVKVWFDAKGGNQVLVKHDNGYTTGYAHLRNANVQVGDEVTPQTALGAVGNTGKSTGSHLHWTVRTPNGAKVDPMSVKWEHGELPPTPRAERMDLQAAYARARRVAEARNLSPKMTRLLYQRLEGHVSDSDALLRRQQADAYDAALTAADKLGDNFTDVKQIPGFANLSPENQHTLRGQAKSNREGDSVKPGGEQYLNLYELAANRDTQDEFVNMDLRPLRSTMSRGEYTQLRKAQVDMRNGGGDASELAIEWSRGRQFSDMYLPQAGIVAGDSKAAQKPENRQRRALYEQRVRDRWAIETRNRGRKLTDDELAAVARAEAATIYQRDESGNRVPVKNFERAEGQRYDIVVPNKDRDQIIAAYRDAYGRTPSMETIARLYIERGGDVK